MNYKTIKITEQIIAVQVKSDYDRSMLFCRVQEFYESPSLKFKRKKFSIWDYFRWYSKKNGCFSYTSDFVGFNVPLVVAKKCCLVNDLETPYDEIMSQIVDRYFVEGQRKYLIGVKSLNDSTFDHEICHAMYYVDDEYRKVMDEITKSISEKNKSTMRKNLKDMGYCDLVFKDEVQAYMSTEINKRFCRGVTGCKKMHSVYKSAFKKMKPI